MIQKCTSFKTARGMWAFKNGETWLIPKVRSSIPKVYLLLYGVIGCNAYEPMSVQNVLYVMCYVVLCYAKCIKKNLNRGHNELHGTSKISKLNRITHDGFHRVTVKNRHSKSEIRVRFKV